MNYLHHLVWRAPLQAATASIRSSEHANVLSVLTKQHSLSIFTQAQPTLTKIAGDSIHTIFNLLKQIDPSDLSDYPVLRKTFKFPINYNDLLGYMTSGAGIVPISNSLSRYLPDTVKSGAPANIKHFYLSLSKNSMINCSNTKDVISSISLCTLNPVALLLYHYSNRTTKCPHYRANTALFFPGLNALSKSEQLMLLSEEQKMTLFMIILAQKTCNSRDCLAAATLITLLQELVIKTASPLTAQSLADAINADEAGRIETTEQQSIHY